MENIFRCFSISIELIVVKVASILLETAGNFASSAQNPVISPALLVSLYALAALLAILAVIRDARNPPRMGAGNWESVVVHVNGVETVELNVAGTRRDHVP